MTTCLRDTVAMLRIFARWIPLVLLLLALLPTVAVSFFVGSALVLR